MEYSEFWSFLFLHSRINLERLIIEVDTANTIAIKIDIFGVINHFSVRKHYEKKITIFLLCNNMLNNLFMTNSCPNFYNVTLKMQ